MRNMDPRDFFRGFFGFPNHKSDSDPRFNQGRNIHPTNDDDEEEVFDWFDERRSYQDSVPRVDVFTNPLDMERFFSHQMEDLMRGFFGAGHLFDEHRQLREMPPGWPMLPPPQGDHNDDDEQVGTGSRDFMLKDNVEKEDGGGGGYVRRNGHSKKWEDGEVSITELDDKREEKSEKSCQHHPDDFTHRFNHRPPPQLLPPGGLFGGIFSADPYFHGQRDDGGGGPGRDNGHWQSFSFGQSSSTSIVTLPDGSRETRQTVTDSKGNRTTTVTRSVGVKSHTVTTVRRPDGSEEKTESSSNVDDQSELQDFSNSSRSWQGPSIEHFGFDPSRFFGNGPRDGGQANKDVPTSPRDEMLKKANETNSSLFKRFFGSD